MKLSSLFALASLCLAGAASASPGMPKGLIFGHTQELPLNAGYLDEIDFGAFAPHPGYNCTEHFAKLPVRYLGARVTSHLGLYTYDLVHSGWATGDANWLSFEDAAACEAMNIEKLNSLALAFQCNEFFLYQHALTWHRKTNVVEAKSWLTHDAVSYGAVFTHY